jgi:hypothetical protein
MAAASAARTGTDAFAWWSFPPPLVEAAAARVLAASLSCAVEVRRAGRDGRPGSWEPRLIVLRSGSPRQVLDAVAATMRDLPDHEVRIAAYEPAGLTRLTTPAPHLCNPMPKAA